jgi:hypothetical protein
MTADDLSATFAQLRLTPTLILLDVNGLLCLKLPKRSPPDLDPNDVIKINGYLKILVRPGVRAFIAELAARYTVGIYSSTTRPNLNKIITGIFGPSHPFIFIADRTLTQPDPTIGTDPTIPFYQTVKNLSSIWNHPELNPDQQWNESNTLLVDHEAHKLRFNPPRNILVTPEFTLQTYQTQSEPLTYLSESILNKISSPL